MKIQSIDSIKYYSNFKTKQNSKNNEFCLADSKNSIYKIPFKSLYAHHDEGVLKVYVPKRKR